MLDIVIINLSMLFAIFLYFDFHVYNWALERFMRLWPAMTLLCLGAFAFTKMYRTLWRYAGLNEAVRIVIGSSVGIGLTYAYSLISLYFVHGVRQSSAMMPQPTYIYAWFILMILAGGSRFSVRIINQLGVNNRAVDKDRRQRVMVVGAGWGGAQIIRQLNARGYREGMPVIAVDDDMSKKGTRILNVPVLYGVVNIPEYAEKYQIDEIIIAIPSATKGRLREIMDACTATNCKLKMVPGLHDVTNGETRLGELRDVNVADLLFRDEVKLDMASISDYLTGKVVLVTGGGGSIGSELCRQILPFAPSRLVVLDIYENNAYELVNELHQKYPNAKVDILIGSVRDIGRLDNVFNDVRPNVVFHAAAHKHVPLMEFSPAEAVKNNVFGTMNTAKTAEKYGVERFVLLSTDKAVNPTNVMGATKRATEMVIQYIARTSKTRFMAVRFGNVLGSNGSVIPLFINQIQAGGPVTITHPDITRYFMTIPEAAQLVLQAGAIGESGNVFVLDMGTPVKIVDLARNLIRLSGYRPDDEIELKITGLRPGEKLYEELMMSEEKDGLCTTDHEKIFVLKPIVLDSAAFEQGLNALRITAHEHPEDVRTALKAIVPTYRMEEQKTAQVG
ncbi:polysaccharide biosynthesis protein [Eubacteriales bacterium OttesenSCG-928-N13]|nr:polysaccharide biosynthesis protein [Eubacteriales bacterium OttesenSCG-928-N13]